MEKQAKYEVIFYTYSSVLKKSFINTEVHKSLDDARLRAMALNWQIQSWRIV